jgi:hypothetical protein
MSKKIKRKDVYNFKKGDRYHLDDIYEVQGIGGVHWWEPDDDDSDLITITCDHYFEINFYT